MSDRLRVLYVTSMAHSGSTLLDLLLAAHSRIDSVGEIKNLVAVPDPGCSCAAEKVHRCPFWERVGRAFRARTGALLREARILRESDADYAAHNRALFESVRDVTGTSLWVDSSKSLERLRGLERAGIVDLFAIHLVRRPEGVAYSHLRKGRGFARLALRHGRRTVETERYVSHLPHATIRYEDLAARPREVLETLMPAIGVPFEASQLDWASRERHNCEGNRMRRSSDSTIRPDVAWKSALPAWQRAAIASLATAGRMVGRFAPDDSHRGVPPPAAPRRAAA